MQAQTGKISGFDDKLVALIESHPSIIIGTCDRALVPSVGRAFGARVLTGRPTLELIVSRWPGRQTQANIRETGRIAATFTAPETFDSYQIKGRARDLGDCDAGDFALAAAYTEAIRARIIALKETPEVANGPFTVRQGLFKVLVEVSDVFLQTPGKNAGRRI